jgi:hypothetical protein
VSVVPEPDLTATQGVNQKFAFSFRSPNGWQDIVWTEMEFNYYNIGSGACFIGFWPGSSQVALMPDDASQGWMWFGNLGQSQATQPNSQCSVDLSNSSMSLNPNEPTTVTLHLSLNFLAGLPGPQQIWMQTADAREIPESRPARTAPSGHFRSSGSSNTSWRSLAVSIRRADMPPPWSVPLVVRPEKMGWPDGYSPNMVNGILRVNANVPAGIGPGAKPIVLTVGQNSNSPLSPVKPREAVQRADSAHHHRLATHRSRGVGDNPPGRLRERTAKRACHLPHIFAAPDRATISSASARCVS